ncbi:MAG: hypothetical protein ACRD2H_12550 [Terriglobales bacterium]
MNDDFNFERNLILAFVLVAVVVLIGLPFLQKPPARPAANAPRPAATVPGPTAAKPPPAAATWSEAVEDVE